MIRLWPSSERRTNWPVNVDRRVNDDYEDARLLRQCLGKLAYADRELAEAARLRRPRHVKDQLTVYCCQLCGFWHMGHR